MPGRSRAPASSSTSVPASQVPQIQLPRVVTDPVAALRPWPIDIKLGRRHIRVPALVAADWLAILMGEFDLFDLIPGLCDEGDDIEVQAALFEGEITVAEFKDACLGLISVAAGRPWWYSLRLIRTVASSWETIGGELAFRSIDANRISLGAWLDATLLICLRGMKPEQTTMFTSQLEMPPPELAQEEAPKLEMSRSQFLAMR